MSESQKLKRIEVESFEVHHKMDGSCHLEINNAKYVIELKPQQIHDLWILIDPLTVE